MKTRTLGGQGLSVSSLGLGCMGMSGSYGGVDRAEAEKTVDRAIELGCTLLDTSDSYGHGHNEEFVGSLIAHRRCAVVVSTKFGHITKADGERVVCGKPSYVLSACEASLRRLRIETIDLYYQHRVDPHIPIEETVGAMSRLVEAGKVRFLGLSEANETTVRRAHRVYPISAVQTEYSLWSRNPELSLLPLLRELEIGLVAYSPLGRGFLAEGSKIAEQAAQDSRSDHPRFSPEAIVSNERLVAAVRAMAVLKNCTSAQLALAWLLARDSHVVPIPGVKRRSHLEENIAATLVQLSRKDIDELDQTFAPENIAGARYPDRLLRTIEL